MFEDGHERPIASIEEHKPIAAPLPGAKLAALAPQFFSNIPQHSEASAVKAPLLEGLNRPMRDQVNGRLQMLQFMGAIEPGTPLAIFTLSSKLRLVEGFTTDAAALTKAIKSLQTGAQPSALLHEQDDQADLAVNTLIGNLDAAGGHEVEVAAMQQFQADVTAYQTDQRV